MTAPEEVILNDFKAHRASVLSEIATANSTLHTLLVNIEEANTKYTEILTDIASSASEHEAIVISTGKRIRSAIDAETKAKTAMDALAVERSKFDEYTARELSRITGAQSEFDAHLRDKQALATSLDSEIPKKQKHLSDIVSEIANWHDTETKGKEEYRIWIEATAKERTDVELELAQTRRDIDAEKALFAQARKDTAAEVAKIVLPQQALAADFNKIAHIKRNVDVYADRVRQAYKKLYPDKPFKI